MLLKRKRRDRKVHNILAMGYVPLYKCMEYIIYDVSVFDMMYKAYYTEAIRSGYTYMKLNCKKYDASLYIDFNSISGIGVKMAEPFECFKYIFLHYVSPANSVGLSISTNQPASPHRASLIIELAIKYHHNKILEFVFATFAKHIAKSLTHLVLDKTRFKQIAIKYRNYGAFKLLDQ